MLFRSEEYAQVIDKAVFPGLQGGPHNHTTAAIAVALKEANTPEFKQYSKQVIKNAKVLSEELIKYGFKIISGGTDNHLFLIDTISSVNLSGKQTSDILENIGITVNKNAIPNDTRKPWDPSGIRVGTPAITTRGMKEEDMLVIAKYINEALNSITDQEILKEKVRKFSSKFPIPGISKTE